MKLGLAWWNVVAAALVGVGGLAMTQFAQTQEPRKDATSKPQNKTDDTTAPKDKDLSLRKFMRAKLDASGQILEGLAVEDFDLIRQGASTLEEMSIAEKWRVSKDPLYREHSVDFQKVARRLTKNAKEEKLEASALTWLEATMQCIECHKWSRANLIAR